MSALRRAGAVWRVLAHRHPDGGPQSDHAYHVQSDRLSNIPDDAHQTTTVLPHTELDEVVIGRWLHLEQLDTGRWLLNVGGVRLDVTADRDGRPTSVSVHSPGTGGDPVDGCRYELDGEAL